MANILIVEDEKSINELIKRGLNMVGHNSFQAYSGLEAISIAEKQRVDLVLLDINLPDLDGFQVIRRLDGIPTIYVTARDDISDRIKGLKGGAEDYIIKPFDMEELLTRVQVVLRRFRKEQTVFVLGNLEIDLKQHSVKLNGSEVDLTNQEFELLKVLVLNKNMALSRNRLLDAAWGADYEGDDRTVDVHIQRLRKKLRLEDQIKTVFKVGYRLEL